MKTDVLLLVEARKRLESGEAAELRETAGLSRGELAQAIGVNRATVCTWEAGHRRPSGSAAIRYARMLRARTAEVASDGTAA